MRAVLFSAFVAVVALTGCYHVRIGESFWLRSRPGPAVDSAAVAAALPQGYTLEPLRVPVAPGVQLAGIAATRAEATSTVLYFGGDDFLVAQHGAATVRALAGAAPVNVVLLDYPGSGASGGTPTLATLKAHALAAYDVLAARPEIAPRGVVVHGHSLGSFVAASIADVRPVRGLVLQSSATTPDDWMRGFFRPSRLKWWARPAYPFLRFTLDSALAGEDNVARVRRYRGPLLVVVGAQDVTTAPAMSRALAAASATPDSLKQLAVLSASGHDDVLVNPQFAAIYGAFVRRVTGG